MTILDQIKAEIDKKAVVMNFNREFYIKNTDMKQIIDKYAKYAEQERTDENLHIEREQAYMQGYEDASKRFRQEPCDDAISRQSAIFLASDLKHDLPDDESIADMVMAHNEGILEYQTQLSLLPPVRPQEQTGHWTALESRFALGDRVECSECGQVFVVGDDVSRNYCPNCGADMRGGVNDN